MKKLTMTFYLCLAVSLAIGFLPAAHGAGSPEITDPMPGSTLYEDQHIFSWTDNGAFVAEWRLFVGTSLGANDVFDSGPLGADKKGCTVSGLPTDGSPVFVRLYYRIYLYWISRDYTYTAATFDGIPIIYDPPAGSSISGESKVFRWSGHGAEVVSYLLVVGTSPGDNDIYQSASLPSWQTWDEVTGLPMDGRPVYVRLFYGLFNGLPLFVGYSYISLDTPAITFPVPGSELSRDFQTFSWTANGSSVENYHLYAGSSPGGNDIFDLPDLGTSTSVVLNGLPVDGRAVYVTLGYLIDGAWGKDQVSYIAQNTPGFTSEFRHNHDGWYGLGGVGEWSDGDGVFGIWLNRDVPYTTYASACYRCLNDDDVDFDNFEYEARISACCADRDYSGIIFRSEPWPILSANYNIWNDGYAFVIGKDGYFQILKILDGWLHPLQDWTPSSAINQGLWGGNLLKVSAYGPTMDFFINHVHVTTVTDYEYASGNVGVIGLKYASDYFGLSITYANLIQY